MSNQYAIRMPHCDKEASQGTVKSLVANSREGRWRFTPLFQPHGESTLMAEATTAKQARVLIVDDNGVVRALLAGIVRSDRRLECVGEVTTGEAALEGLRVYAPDVICLDAMLPGMDGMAVLESIRERAVNTAVVMITGYATPELIEKARALGASGFVIKPFSASKVLSSIHSALNGTA
jgi:two-component system, chemotaxis family, chemotaxis protein CheY